MMLVGSTVIPYHLIVSVWLGPLNMKLLVFCAIGAGVMDYSTLLRGKAMKWLMPPGSLNVIS